jgi:hypothetical protein
VSYPTLIVEVASSESSLHVMNKGQALLSLDTSIQIVVIILIRFKSESCKGII